MILSEFWESKEKLAIACSTKEQSKRLRVIFDKLGKRWRSGDSYLELDYWTEKSHVCYTNGRGFVYEESDSKKGYKLINFDEIIAYAEVVNPGQNYSSYDTWFARNGCGYLKEKFAYKEVSRGQKFLILKIGPHSEYNDYKLFALLDEKTDKVYLVGEKGLRLIREGENNMNEFGKVWSEILARKGICVETEDTECLYSFRFNEERKSVTLYKNGEKVQFIKCQPEDKFSWKIGLGVAFYKEFFKETKDKNVEWIKNNMVSWKVFYNYMLAYALNFDKEKLERLESRVKKAKLYKEIKIND